MTLPSELLRPTEKAVGEPDGSPTLRLFVLALAWHQKSQPPDLLLLTKTDRCFFGGPNMG